MSTHHPLPLRPFRFALADSIACVNPLHWDHVVANAGLFLSRPFLELLEAHLPEKLTPHYAMIYRGDAPLAALVGQSLEIRMADLPAGSVAQQGPGWWQSLGTAAQRSLALARRRFLLFGGGASGEWLYGLWPDVASDLWHGLWKAAEHAAETSVGPIHLRFLVCGNLLSWGPHGVAFAPEADPAPLWPAVVEALAKIQRSSTLFGESDIVMIKDLTDEQVEAAPALRRGGFHRFETEPNMVLHPEPSWHSFEDYLKALKSDRRNSIRHSIRELEAAGIVLERLTPEQVQAKAPEIHALYLQVHLHQKLRLVEIREDWIPALAMRFRDDFRVIAARSREGGPLLGFITIIRDGDGAMGYYVGFDKATAARGLPLYLGLFYAALGQAFEMGATRISLGRTALGPKAQVGAKAQNMYGYLRHHNPALNLALPGILALLPMPKQSPEHHPFKREPL